ncbi:hypothetical protein GGQ86_000680 [Xanthobacter flavus]|uniref:Uncharacterized protein n=1 Tax=Xanthobacter flavus TaxID=281 RepID=A0ABU1KBM3_XANFL|nr:hypothetical protein [Xanthobacter flavus]
MTGEGIHRRGVVAMLLTRTVPARAATAAARWVKANMPNLSSRLQTRLMTGVEHMQ